MMEREIKKFRGEIKSIILPVVNISFYTGILFVVAILFKENFKVEITMIKATLILEAVLVPFISILMVSVTFDYKITVFNDGISLYNPFGNRERVFMQWSAMKYLKIRNILGNKYYLFNQKI